MVGAGWSAGAVSTLRVTTRAIATTAAAARRPATTTRAGRVLWDSVATGVSRSIIVIASAVNGTRGRASGAGA